MKDEDRLLAILPPELVYSVPIPDIAEDTDELIDLVGQPCSGVYDPNQNLILLHEDWGTNSVLAHEWRHHWQNHKIEGILDDTPDYFHKYNWETTDEKEFRAIIADYYLTQPHELDALLFEHCWCPDDKNTLHLELVEYERKKRKEFTPYRPFNGAYWRSAVLLG